MKKVEVCFSAFVKTHEAYVEALEEDTLEKDAEKVLDEQFQYHNDIEDKFSSIRKLYNKFVKNTSEEEAVVNDASVKKKKCSQVNSST